MKDLFRYNKKKKKPTGLWSNIKDFFGLYFWLIVSVLHIYIFYAEGSIFLSFTLGIIYFIIIISILLLLTFFEYKNRSKYLVITEEKIMWKKGLMKPDEELLLERVESFTILEDTIRINQKEGKVIVLEKSNIRSTKKKKELERVLRKINKDNQFV